MLSSFLQSFFSRFQQPSRSLLLFCCPHCHVFEASRCFFSAVSKASPYFVGCLFAVVIGLLGSFSSAILEVFSCFCRTFRKLLIFFAAVLEASRCFRRPSWKLFTVLVCRFCNQPLFSQPLLQFSCSFLTAILAVLVACSSCSFLAKLSSGFPFLTRALINIHQVRAANVWSNGTLIARSMYAPSTGWYGNFFMSPTVLHFSLQTLSSMNQSVLNNLQCIKVTVRAFCML